jgi:hypothetical protein
MAPHARRFINDVSMLLAVSERRSPQKGSASLLLVFCSAFLDLSAAHCLCQWSKLTLAGVLSTCTSEECFS